MNAEELDQKFDDGKDVLDYFDLSTARSPGLELQQVNVDFPQWTLEALDREAQHIGVHH